MRDEDASHGTTSQIVSAAAPNLLEEVGNQGAPSMMRSYRPSFRRSNARLNAAVAACLSLAVVAAPAHAGKKGQGASKPATVGVRVTEHASVVVTEKLVEHTPAAAKPAPFNPFAQMAANRGMTMRPQTAPVETTAPGMHVETAHAAPRAAVDVSPERGHELTRSLESHKQELSSLTSRKSSAESKLSSARDSLSRAKRDVEEERSRADRHASAVALKEEKSRELSSARRELDALPREESKSESGGFLRSWFGSSRSESEYTSERSDEPKHEVAVEKRAENDNEKDGDHKSSKSEKAKLSAKRSALRDRIRRLENERDDAERTADRTRPRYSTPSMSELEGRENRARLEMLDSMAELETVTKAHASAQERVTSTEASLDEWKTAEQRANVERIYATLEKVTERAGSAKGVSARWGAKIFSVQKAIAAKASDNRDAVSILEQPDGSLRLAVADGSSVGQMTGEWAKMIAHGFTGELNTVDPQMPKTGTLPTVGDKESLKSWLTPFHAEWSRLVAAGGPIARRAVEMTGGMTTLVGLEIKPASNGGWTWHATGAGDSNMFVVRGGKLVTAWPLTEASQFNSSPAALSFLLDKNPAHAWVTHSGTMQAGDEVYVTTDAMAKWILDGGEKAPARLAQLKKVTDKDSFQTLVSKARAKDMNDDDTTMAHFVVPAAKGKE